MATVELTKDNFDDVVEKNDIVIVDFWAPWCGPCRAFAPIFERASGQHADVVFGKVNTDVERELAGAFQIRSIPTLSIFREQIMIFSQPGMLPEPALMEVLQKAKALDMEQVKKDVSEAEHAQKNM